MEMTNKERYHQFCLNNSVYVPVFSRDWWMDAVCGPDQWDVYLVGDGMDIRAAFVYYLCEDQEGVCIKRAPITQNNGIIFKYPENQGVVAKQHYEEKIVAYRRRERPDVCRLKPLRRVHGFCRGSDGGSRDAFQYDRDFLAGGFHRGQESGQGEHGDYHQGGAEDREVHPLRRPVWQAGHKGQKSGRCIRTRQR